MDRLSDIDVFVSIVDAGGVSAAARALGSSPPAISRRLAALESRLGVRLAERSSRRFRLTDEGALYFNICQGVINDLRDAEAEISARGGIARGLLKVGAPMELGRRRISPLLADFVARHPGLSAHLVLSDAGLEVGEDALDVALRFGRPDDPSIIARKLATTPKIVCASPAYLNERGAPLSPEALSEHNCLRLARRHALVDRWRFLVDGAEFEIKVAGTLSSGSGDVLHNWVLEGRGLSFEALWDVEEDLKQGRLVECLTDFRYEYLDLFATFAPGKPVPPRIRLFVDFVAEEFSRC